MKKLAAVLVMVLVLATGCATAPTKITWYKPGATQQDYAKDAYECTQETIVSTGEVGGPGWIGLVMIASARQQAQTQANTLFKMCMEARGWHGEVQKDNK